MCGMMRPYVRHDSIICVACLIHLRARTHSHVQHDAFKMCDVNSARCPSLCTTCHSSGATRRFKYLLVQTCSSFVLQHVARTCRVLRFVAKSCSTIRRLHTFVVAYILELVLQRVQCVAERCRALQCAAVCCSAIRRSYIFFGAYTSNSYVAACGDKLQRVAACCSALQCVAIRSIYQKGSSQVKKELQKNMQPHVLVEISLAFKATLTL